MIEQTMESCCRFVFLQWLWHFWRPFPLKFLGKSRARETTNAPLSRHFHCLYFGNLRSGPILAVLVHSLLRGPAKIGPDPKSHKFARAATRFWPQRWLAVRAIPRDLIGCWNQRKLKAFILRVAGSTKQSSWMIRRQRREGFCCFFFLIVLRSCGRKIFLNMCHGNSENSNSCPYPLRICFIYGTNVSVSRSWIPLQVVDREKDAFWFTNKWVQVNTHYHHLQTGFIWKFRREWLLWTGYVRGGSLREKLQMALKQVGMHFVLNRLIQLRVLSWTCTRYVFEAFFLPKQGQGFNPPAVHLYPNVGRVPAGIQSRSLVKCAIKLKKCSRVSVDCPQKQ